MTSPRKKLAFTLIALGLMLAVGLVLLEAVLRATAEHRGNATFLFGKRWYYLAPVGIPDEMPDVRSQPGAYRAYDPDLGWSVQPFGRGEDPNLAGKGTTSEIYFSDAAGFRCDELAHKQAVAARADASGNPPTPDRAYNLVCIGDSFTHGDAVLAEEAWPSHLGRILDQSVANLGVGGFGIDQAVMRYELKNPRCSHVLLGLISGDFERATHLIYNFTFGDVKSKPIYEFSEQGMTVFNRPALHGDPLLDEYKAGADSTFFPRARFSWNPKYLQRHDFDVSYCFRLAKSVPLWRADRSRQSICVEDGERLAYCLRILAHLKQLTASREANLTVVLLGEPNIFHSRTAGGGDHWSLVKSKLDAAEIRWIDTTPGVHALFKLDPARVINAADGVHYTPEANLRVAEIIADQLSPQR